MNNNIPVSDWLRAARVLAAECVGWYAPALYAAQLVITEECPHPAAIDRFGRVYFSSSWVEQIYELSGQDRRRTVEQLAYLWVHEVSHWLREHADRAEDLRAQAEIWNIACDLEINDFVPEGLLLPYYPGKLELVLPERFGLPEGQTAEWYYRQLTANPTPSPSPQAGSEADGEGQEPGDEGSEAEGKGQEPGDEGSGVHGQPRSWEVPATSEETPILNDFDRQSLREEVATRIKEHLKNRGTVPAGWIRWAEEILQPRVNWREQLKRVMRGAISEGLGQRLDYSMRRPNRRASVYEPFFMPSLHGEYRPRVVCVVDTSGSIGNEELAQAMAEVRGVLEQVRVPVTIIPCDAVPYEAIEVLTKSDWQSARTRLQGGGGTDMTEGLNAALAMKPPPDVVLILTDGYTPYPTTRPPKTVVIWGVWQNASDWELPLPPLPALAPSRYREDTAASIRSHRHLH